MYEKFGDGSAVSIGLRMRRIRQAAGLKQKELAKRAGVSTTSVVFWETARYNKISARSLAKLLKAICEAGVDCCEEWLLRGIGAEPKIRFQLAQEPASYQALPSLKNQLIEIKELELFTNNVPQAIVTEIRHNQLMPWLKKGDFVGGVWRTAEEVTKSDFCIVPLSDELPVYYVTPAGNNHFYLNYQTTESSSFQETHALSKLVPIVRVWRQLTLKQESML